MRDALKEAGLQIPVLTNRKCIRGRIERVSKHIIIKPVTNNLYFVDASGIGRKIMLLPGEVSTTTCWLSREVSRIHSS